MEKKEYQLLLDINMAIATVKGCEELLKTIIKKLQPVFGFHDVGLFIVNREEDYHIDLATEIPEINPSEANTGFLKRQFDKIPYHNSAAEWMMNQALEAGGTVILDYVNITDRFPEHRHTPAVKKTGYKECFVGILKVHGEILGMFCMNALEKGLFKTNQIPFFQVIADQLALSVSNVRANEDIQQREREMALQVEVVDALNDQEDWEQRFIEVAKALQGYIPFDMITFGPLDQERDHPRLALERIGVKEYRSIALESFLNLSKIDLKAYNKFRTTFKHVKPRILNRDDVLQLPSENIVHRNVHKLFRINSMMLIPIITEKNSWYFSFFSKKWNAFSNAHLELFQKIQASFILALDKTLSYEEVIDLNNKLKEEKAYLEGEVERRYNFEEMIGSSQIMEQVFEKVKIVVNTDTTVLVLGETGTGKELIARALHNASSRKLKPLIKVNCAMLPKELIESELFGHEKGAFTGAVNQRIGKFELADGGSIFLDEIGELPLELQGKLLRVIQEKEFERLGGHKTIKLDTRIIAATNRDLEKEVTDRNFRSDLYFRLSVFPIKLPPLREREEDLEALALYFLKKYASKVDKKVDTLTKTALQTLKLYHWPGNVRELEHVIERSVLLTEGRSLNLALEKHTKKTGKTREFVFRTLQDAETELIFETLKRCKGKIRGKNGAAEILGVPPSTLEYRMKRAGVTKEMVIGMKRTFGHSD